MQSASLKTKQFCETSSTFELDNVKKEAVLRDCETFSIFEVDKSKNEAILRDVLNFRSWQKQKRSNSADFLQKWKVECRADGLIPMHFAIFPVYVSKVLRLPRKIDARSHEVLHLLRKITSQNWISDAPKWNPRVPAGSSANRISY